MGNDYAPVTTPDEEEEERRRLAVTYPPVSVAQPTAIGSSPGPQEGQPRLKPAPARFGSAANLEAEADQPGAMHAPAADYAPAASPALPASPALAHVRSLPTIEPRSGVSGLFCLLSVTPPGNPCATRICPEFFSISIGSPFGPERFGSSVQSSSLGLGAGFLSCA